MNWKPRTIYTLNDPGNKNNDKLKIMIDAAGQFATVYEHGRLDGWADNFPYNVRNLKFELWKECKSKVNHFPKWF